MKPQFSAHGTSEYSIKDSIIFINVRGPWNAEFFPQFHQQLLSAVPLLNIENYAVLLSPIGEALVTPEGYQTHLEFVSQVSAKAVAINLQQCDTKVVSGELFTKLYREAGLKSEVFDDSNTALSWLNKQLSPA